MALNASHNVNFARLTKVVERGDRNREYARFGARYRANCGQIAVKRGARLRIIIWK